MASQNFATEEEMLAGFYDDGVDSFLSTLEPGEILWLGQKIGNMKITIGQPTPTERVRAWADTPEARGAAPQIVLLAMSALNEVKTHPYDAAPLFHNTNTVIRTAPGGWSAVHKVHDHVSLEEECEAWNKKLAAGFDIRSEKPFFVRDDDELKGTFFRSMTMPPQPTREEFVARKIATISQDCILVNQNTGAVTKTVKTPVPKVKAQFHMLSSTITALVNRHVTAKLRPRYFLYDSVMRNTRDFQTVISKRLAAGAPPQWRNRIVRMREDGKWVGTPNLLGAPIIKKYSDSSAMLYDIRTVFSKKGLGRVASSIVDGVPMSSDTRQVVNALNDVIVPSDVNVVYYDTASADEVQRLIRKTGRSDLVVFYKGAYLPKEEERKIFANGVVKAGGKIPVKNIHGYDFSKLKTLYINLTVSSPSIVKSKVFVDSVKNTAESDARKLDYGKDAYDYYIVRTHVLSYCSEFWSSKKPSEHLEYPKAKFYYVSASVATMNVIATNVSRKSLRVDALTRDDLVPVYLAIAAYWIQFPVSRLPITTIKFQSITGLKSVALFPRMQFIPNTKATKIVEAFGGGVDEDDVGFKLTFRQANDEMKTLVAPPRRKQEASQEVVFTADDLADEDNISFADEDF